MKKGIFWCTDRSADPPAFIIVSAECDAEGNDLSEDICFSSKSGVNFNHRAEWTRLDRKITGGRPFNYYPRGRVEIRKGKATIYLNPVLSEERTVSEVKRLFDLKEGPGLQAIRVVSDGSGHYQYEQENETL